MLSDMLSQFYCNKSIEKKFVVIVKSMINDVHMLPVSNTRRFNVEPMS